MPLLLRPDERDVRPRGVNRAGGEAGLSGHIVTEDINMSGAKRTNGCRDLSEAPRRVRLEKKR